jgi:hypothetical protein
VDFDALIERHALLGMSREQILAALPMLRGMGPEPAFTEPHHGGDTLPLTTRVLNSLR